MKIFYKLPLIVFISLIALSCNSQQKSKQKDSSKSAITIVTPAEFLLKSENQVIVDVRTPEEFSDGHIARASNINFFDADFLDKFSKYDKNSPIFIYCRSGGRSGKASKKLSELGFKKVFDLKGGYLNWVDSNQKTEN